MVMYRATAEGQIEMTKEEEAEILAEWETAEKPQEEIKTDNSRIDELEAQVFELSKKMTRIEQKK